MTRRHFLVLVFLALSTTGLLAQSGTNVVSFEVITVEDVAIGITPAVSRPNNQNTTVCWATLEDGPIRYRMDGVDPEATVGHPLTAGSQLKIESYNNIIRFRAIASGSTAGILTVSCSR